MTSYQTSHRMVRLVAAVFAAAFLSAFAYATFGWIMLRRQKRHSGGSSLARRASATRDNIMDEISTRMPPMRSLLPTLCCGFALLFGAFGLSADVGAATIAF